MPDLYELRRGTTLAHVAPARGGIVTQFSVAGVEVLFLDQATFDDPAKNVRGGIPVLFPTPGKLAGDRWSYGGHTGSLPQHGFARNRAWQVVSAQPHQLVLRIEDAPEWPWPFVLELTYTVGERSLRIDQRVTNTGSEPMPFGLGFHPYFLVPDADKAGARIETAATRGFDNVTKQSVAFTTINLTAKEVDLHLDPEQHHAATSALSWGGRQLRLSGSPEFTRWVVWTLAGRDFVCLEPWTSPGDGLNQNDILRVEPGQTRLLFVELTYTESAIR